MQAATKEVSKIFRGLEPNLALLRKAALIPAKSYQILVNSISAVFLHSAAPYLHRVMELVLPLCVLDKTVEIFSAKLDFILAAKSGLSTALFLVEKKTGWLVHSCCYGEPA